MLSHCARFAPPFPGLGEVGVYIDLCINITLFLVMHVHALFPPHYWHIFTFAFHDLPYNSFREAECGTSTQHITKVLELLYSKSNTNKVYTSLYQ